MSNSKQLEERKKFAKEVLNLLKKEYPNATSLLNYSNPFQALVAVILSAQTTDEQVNRVTPILFQKYPDLDSLAQGDIREVAEIIKSVGLYRTKARHLVKAAQMIKNDFSGQIPDSLEELLKLPGVGRKTANVLLSIAFGKPGLGVDTHVHRVANRTGLAEAKQPLHTEKQLKEVIPVEEWGKTHHLLIFHGRKICKATKPACSKCILNQICRYPNRLSPSA